MELMQAPRRHGLMKNMEKKYELQLSKYIVSAK